MTMRTGSRTKRRIGHKSKEEGHRIEEGYRIERKRMREGGKAEKRYKYGDEKGKMQPEMKRKEEQDTRWQRKKEDNRETTGPLARERARGCRGNQIGTKITICQESMKKDDDLDQRIQMADEKWYMPSGTKTIVTYGVIV